MLEAAGEMLPPSEDNTVPGKRKDQRNTVPAAADPDPRPRALFIVNDDIDIPHSVPTGAYPGDILLKAHALLGGAVIGVLPTVRQR